MAGTIHIDDLASPRFSPDVAEVMELVASMDAAGQLDSDALREQAARDCGLDDFGARDYEERLAVLLGALRDIDGLTPFGRLGLHAQVLQLLKNRLLLTDLLRRHPEICEVDLSPPLIIAGLPRTGTTHLHNLLAADRRFRTLPYWESLEPFPLPSEVDVEPDPRRMRTEAALEFMHRAMPLFPLMHEMTTDHVHEEIALLAIDFSTMFFETLGAVPAWEAYYKASDQTPHYRYLRTALQALQFQRPGERWLLKSPQHLEQLPVLAEVFPDATVIVTHREPVSVVVSMATMIAYTARMHAYPVRPDAIGRAWALRIEALLTACLRHRDVLPVARSMDVRFDDFLADDVGTVRRVYELAGLTLEPDVEGAIEAYLAGHGRGRLGRIDYRASAVGLDEAELWPRFTSYRQRFLT